MKRKFNYLIAMALMAFTFTSCEDVPSPFGEVVPPKSDDVVVIEPSGTGTEADPFNIAGVIEYVSGLGADVASPKDVYFKGIITSITEAYGTQYGNATFEVSDTEDGGNKFLCYRVKYFDGQSYSNPSDPNIKEGNEVIMCGKVVNYKGNTPETSANAAWLYSLNGTKGGGSTPQPSGEAKKVSIADFLAAKDSDTEWYQLTGTVKNLKDGDQYGNFDLDDGTGSVYVYGLLAEKDGAKQKFQELVAAKGIKNGSKLTINGLRSTYNEKAQVKNAYFVSVENGDTPTPSGTGDGTENNPYNVPGAIAKAEQTGVWVKAFIVGWVEGQAYDSGAKFNSEATVKTNILIAASADETDVTKCMPVQLPTGDVRTKLNLQDNPGNLKKEVILYGDIATYFKVPGIKNTSYAVIDGTGVGTKPGGGDTPSGGEGADGSKIVTVAEFNAASESDDVWYQLTGTVENLKDGDQYGNFDLNDGTASVYVYGLLSEKGGAKKLFQELVAAKGIKNGSKITIVGLRSSYNGKIQVKNAYFIKVENEGGGGGGAETGADGSTIISVSGFNAAAESTDVWYQLTGTVKNLKDNDQYGNFDLEDSTGSVYVYGLLSEKGGAKKKFQDLVAAKGIANGKTITIVGNRGSYNGKIEVTNAYFISIK
ncbi:MAG: hypothetical protein II866_08055 [Prevotella sp.]|nr:hypothetical protein [Prevotella sp.]MBQ3768930.1 hypothetical protein [Prevotella sp.]